MVQWLRFLVYTAGNVGSIPGQGTNLHAKDAAKKKRERERERQIPYDIPFMWNLKYDANEFIYETETDSQT